MIIPTAQWLTAGEPTGLTRRYTGQGMFPPARMPAATPARRRIRAPPQRAAGTVGLLWRTDNATARVHTLAEAARAILDKDQ
jgi:hypothetical protein